jgi:hypothetical protein
LKIKKLIYDLFGEDKKIEKRESRVPGIEPGSQEYCFNDSLEFYHYTTPDFIFKRKIPINKYFIIDGKNSFKKNLDLLFLFHLLY